MEKINKYTSTKNNKKSSQKKITYYWNSKRSKTKK